MLAYAGIDQKDLGPQLSARGLEASLSTIERVAGRRTPNRRARLEYLAAIAEVCRFPMEFFYADFDRLAEIVPAGTMVIGPRAAPPDLPRLPGESGPLDPLGE